jgi:putative glutamine amidotransferase
MRKLLEPEALDTTDAAGSAAGHIVLTGQGAAGQARIPKLYAHALVEAGGTPRIFSPFDTLREGEQTPGAPTMDMGIATDDLSPLEGAVGLLLPGGGDIDPSLYGASPHPETRPSSPERDSFESNMLREALRRDMPVLCICRGMQLLNALLGGTLDQHLADNPDRLEHDRDIPRAEPVHSIRVHENSDFHTLLEGMEAPVNSHHHQGLDVVADGLREIAWAGDGVLEAVRGTDFLWLLGVQWHPEVMAPVDHRQMRIFERFVAATKRYAASRRAA